MLGGGILSLPFALYASGLFLGGLALVLSAVANAFTLDLLVTLSYGTGQHRLRLSAISSICCK